MKTILTVFAAFVMMGTMSTKAEAANCTVDLINGRGMTLDYFYGYGYNRVDACQEAKQDCNRAVRAGYYQARILKCEVRGGEYGRYVTQTCQAEMRGPRGHRVLQYFMGQATGPRGSGVKAQACREALRQCNRAKVRQGRHHAICTAEGSVVRPGPRPAPGPRPGPRPRPGRGGRGGRI